jgi:hypothetical protein
MLAKWQSDIPSFSKVIGTVLLLLNIFIPPLGTLLSACLSPKFVVSQIIVGVLQFLLLFIIVGWIWSIWWGILIFLKSK